MAGRRRATLSAVWGDPSLVEEASACTRAVDASIAEASASAWQSLVASGRSLGPEAPPAEAPPAYARVLGGAIAYEEAHDPARAEQLRRHYLDAMPRARIAQLCGDAEPNARLFHETLDWSRIPHVWGAVERLATLAGLTPAEVLGAPSVQAFFDERPTLGALFARSFYGGMMPLLYGAPGDLALVRRRLSTGASLESTIDAELAAGIVHELTHGRRRRATIVPPYLDECVAAFAGVSVLPEFAVPSGSTSAIYATPWFSQVGRALARAFGEGPVLRAHFGAASWVEVLPPGFADTCARLGWEEYLEHRAPHFLSSNWRPAPWMKLFFLAAAGAPFGEVTLSMLDAMPWSSIEPGPEDFSSDRRMLDDALSAMCLHNRRIGGTHRVSLEVPASEVTIDLARCVVETAPAPDSCDTVTLAHLFPPATARRLRDAGLRGWRLRIDAIEALPEIADAVFEGKAIARGEGFSLVA